MGQRGRQTDAEHGAELQQLSHSACALLTSRLCVLLPLLLSPLSNCPSPRLQQELWARLKPHQTTCKRCHLRARNHTAL